jgi:WD40 repeat protein
MADISEDTDHLEQLAVTLKRRLRVLEMQRGRFAERDTPAHLVLEIEDIRRELVRIEADLRRLRPSATDARSPYLGLATFQEANADLFFGRDALVANLVEYAGRAPFLAVLGASGSGKSSVVRAGLIPMLKGGNLPGSEHWRYLVFKPGARPLDALAAELAKLQGGDLGAALTLSRQLAESDRALLLAADMLLDRSAGQRLVLVVDQFEELWTLLPAEAVQRAALLAQQQVPFIQLLLAAVAAPDTPLLVVLTMRADFLHRAAEHPELARAIAEHDVIVSPMTPAELRDAIVRPAELSGGSFESGLIDELIAQTRGREGALPLLEYTLLELWKQRRTDGTMTWDAYQIVGGVEGALAARADAILAERYTPKQQDELRQVLLRLVQPGEGATDTRRRVRLNDVVPAGETLDALQTLLKPITDERLLTTGRDSATGDETIEVTHEALIRAWPRLVGWIAEARDDLQLQLQLEEAANEWQANSENPGLLWSGLRLSKAEDWIERARPRLNARDSAFLDSSRAEEQRRANEAAAAERDRQRLQEEQRNARRLRRFLLAVGVLLAVAIGAGVVAFRSRQDAIQSRDDAQQASARAGMQRQEAEKARDLSRQLAWAGQSLFNVQRVPERAMLFALAAQPTNPLDLPEPSAARALFSAFDDGRIRLTLHSHSGPIWAVAWSPDGKMALTGNDDGTARIWNAQNGQEIRTLSGHNGSVWAVAWSNDGKMVLTGSDDNTAKLWDAGSGQELHTFSGHTGSVNVVAWSPDGKKILTVSSDGTAKVWDASNRQELRTFSDHGNAILAVAWSPDGKMLLTGQDDNVAKIWDVASGQEITTLTGHTGYVSTVAWSPDGKLLLTASTEDHVRVWDTSSWRQLRTFADYTRGVNSAAWSPDSKFILTGSRDQTARVWEASTGREVYILAGHTGSVSAVAWSPDGTKLLTGSFDRTARVWDAGGDQALRILTDHTDLVSAVAWSPDGKLVLTGSQDNTAKIWDAGSWQVLRTLSGHSDGVSAVAWSPDGKLILTGSQDNTAKIWDAGSGRELRTLSGHSDHVLAVAWSPDVKLILTGSQDNTAKIWDAGSGRELRTLSGHVGPVFAVAWSPDSKFLLTGSADETARVWDANTGQELHVLNNHTSFVNAVAWSPDGKFMLTGSDDQTAKIWDARSGQELRTLTGHLSIVNAVAWSPDGNLIITGSQDDTAKVWDANSGLELRTLAGHTGSILVVAWSPDSKMLLTGSDDNTARVWHVNRRLVIADLTRRVCDIYAHDDAKIRAEVPDWNWPGCAAALAAVDADLKELDALRSGQ